MRRAARLHGFIDPFTVLARLRQFAEPSEVAAPLELIRAWAIFQARGIVNTQAIQHNLDWVWPYWVERQFNPRDHSFVPRSFSMSHINLTHRNWTAVCVPDIDVYALVDPRGLVTPLHDGWSLDAWVVSREERLVPSRMACVRQRMCHSGELAIETEFEKGTLSLCARCEMGPGCDEEPCVELRLHATGHEGDSLCVALRPYNPEGIQFIDSLESLSNAAGWLVNGHASVLFDKLPDRCAASTYREGDVFNRLMEEHPVGETKCPVGMATAAALFRLDASGAADVMVTVPVPTEPTSRLQTTPRCRASTSWQALDALTPILEIPDHRMIDIYRAATRTLLSLSAGDIVPGSYTYRRFWFRDACIMLHALLTLNHEESGLRAFETTFSQRQTLFGFFESQQGEWDSNGQVLWLAERYRTLTNRPLNDQTLKMLRKGAAWLCRKRRRNSPGDLHPGLLPPGFSAEHLGPNNYYYWDNFWGLAGLQAARNLFGAVGDDTYAEELAATVEAYEHAILASIAAIPESQCRGAMPAAPGRRMDAGAIGSIVADYPLQLFDAADLRVMKTVEFLLSHCMIDNGFFHDMTHSGINPYLTLHLAQVLLRAGDQRYIPLVRRVAELASPTGQWPEAIHPHTGGGCMGDGQHGWAAAEWVLMMRSLFIREEPDRLVVASGLLPEWLQSGKPLRFGPTATRFGKVTVAVDTAPDRPRVTVEGEWHAAPPSMDICLPDAPPGGWT
ncbi:MAG: hypothetical protein EOM20_04625 [Spartobacteria bacterium]|nr:hypothetical protein [Spartobacteria bacterium]